MHMVVSEGPVLGFTNCLHVLSVHLFGVNGKKIRKHVVSITLLDSWKLF